jgi:hypothetical protein
MNHSIEDIELVERYFDNTLTDQETAQLTIKLQKDAELLRIFEQEKLLVKTIRFRAAENDLKFLKHLEKSLSQPGKRYLPRHWYYYAAAACITVFALAGILMPASQQTPQELYASYFEPYPNVFEPALRGSGSLLHRQAINKRAEAFQAYDERSYEKAAQLFAELLTEKQDPGMLLLLGNSNLALNNTEDAKKNFNDLIANFDGLDIQAKWFLSLCYLKEGQTEKARNLLEELGETEISYAKKAKKLLKEVD